MILWQTFHFVYFSKYQRQTCLFIRVLQSSNNRAHAWLWRHSRKRVHSNVHHVGPSLRRGQHGSYACSRGIMGVYVDRQLGKLGSKGADQQRSAIGLQNTSHVLLRSKSTPPNKTSRKAGSDSGLNQWKTDRNKSIHHFHWDRNATCLPPSPPQEKGFQIPPGCYSHPKRNRRKWLCKIFWGKKGALTSQWRKVVNSAKLHFVLKCA